MVIDRKLEGIVIIGRKEVVSIIMRVSWWVEFVGYVELKAFYE